MLVHRCLSQRQFLLRALPEWVPIPTQASCCLPGNVLLGPLFVRRFRCQSHLAKHCGLREHGRLGPHDWPIVERLIHLHFGLLVQLLRFWFRTHECEEEL